MEQVPITHIYRLKDDGRVYQVATVRQLDDAADICRMIEHQGDTALVDPPFGGLGQNLTESSSYEHLNDMMHCPPAVPWSGYIATRMEGLTQREAWERLYGYREADMGWKTYWDKVEQ